VVLRDCKHTGNHEIMNGPHTRVLLLVSAHFGAWGAESSSAESACSLSGDRLWFDT